MTAVFLLRCASHQAPAPAMEAASSDEPRAYDDATFRRTMKSGPCAPLDVQLPECGYWVCHSGYRYDPAADACRPLSELAAAVPVTTEGLRPLTDDCPSASDDFKARACRAAKECLRGTCSAQQREDATVYVALKRWTAVVDGPNPADAD